MKGASRFSINRGSELAEPFRAVQKSSVMDVLSFFAMAIESAQWFRPLVKINEVDSFPPALASLNKDVNVSALLPPLGASLVSLGAPVSNH